MPVIRRLLLSVGRDIVLSQEAYPPHMLLLESRGTSSKMTQWKGDRQKQKCQTSNLFVDVAVFTCVWAKGQHWPCAQALSTPFLFLRKSRPPTTTHFPESTVKILRVIGGGVAGEYAAYMKRSEVNFLGVGSPSILCLRQVLFRSAAAVRSWLSLAIL